MKKFISMVMAAAMVVSLVPATAFASSANIKVVGDKEYTEEVAEVMEETPTEISGPEIQLDITDVDQKNSNTDETFEVSLSFENAEVEGAIKAGTVVGKVIRNLDNTNIQVGAVVIDNAVEDEDDTIDLLVVESKNATKDNQGKAVKYNFTDDDLVVIDVAALNLILTKSAAGTEVTVDVDGDFGSADGLVVAAVLEEGVSVTLKKVGEVAEEEVECLESKLTIEADVDKFYKDQTIELKLNSGFEWDMNDAALKALAKGQSFTAEVDEDDDDTLILTITKDVAKIEIAKDLLWIEAVDAKVGDVATITAKVKEGTATDGWKATATAVDALEVIGESVEISVEEDEDVPVIYSGVNSDNDGITDDSDHKSLEITIEESVAEAFDVKDELELKLPAGVFVTAVEAESDWTVAKTGEFNEGNDVENAFAAAYEEGEYEGFVFERKTFNEMDDACEMVFTLELVAVPGFTGDVEVELLIDGESVGSVVVATFVSPYTVAAEANDLIIDYRNTEVPTDIVVTEAEAGLWEDSAEGALDDALTFTFEIERFDDDAFEGDATYTVNEESDMEVKEAKDGLGFEVDTESDDEAAVVTISDISLYMSRSLAAGAYDLEMGTNAGYAMMNEVLWTAEKGAAGEGKYCAADVADWDFDTKDYADAFEPEYATVKEGFVNVVTAGRDADDASFTKKVVVPVGESYIVAGEQTVALDVPAYVSAAGYTMLPVRAVAVALGILNNNVLWDQATKTVTILYGQRIITMQVGAKVVYVNGSAIPASASPEVVDGRTFLPMRDLATALGVTDITWDAATKTATLNGNK